MESCLEKIKQLIKERCGVTFEQKEYFFRTRLLEAMEHFGILECSQLFEQLEDPKKFERFLSHFMVSQSYFFREEKQFEILVSLILRQAHIHPKILCLPCANGEEPYSIAIYLLENGIENFSIDAFDINPQAIQKGIEGAYCERDVSRLPAKVIERYFIQDGDRFIVSSSVREHINFAVRNLFELQNGSYDYIFCRNLMIYLTPAKRAEAIRIFHNILNDGGHLFLSFSDYVSEIEGFDKISLENIYIKSG